MDFNKIIAPYGEDKPETLYQISNTDNNITMVTFHKNYFVNCNENVEKIIDIILENKNIFTQTSATISASYIYNKIIPLPIAKHVYTRVIGFSINKNKNNEMRFEHELKRNCIGKYYYDEIPENCVILDIISYSQINKYNTNIPARMHQQIIIMT